MSALNLLSHILTDKREIEIAFHGDKEIIENIKRKKKLLQEKNSRHKFIRPLLLMPGGGQRGVISGGVAMGLQATGVTDAFDTVVGISSGAATAYYMLAGDAAIGTTIYYEENIRHRLFQTFNPWHFMNIEALEATFQSLKPAHKEHFEKSRPAFFVGVTHVKTGENILLNARAFKDPVSCITASCCVPYVSRGKKVLLHGHEYVDGGISNPLPIAVVIEKFHPTDILLVMTQPLHWRKAKPPFFIDKLSFLSPKILQETLLLRWKIFAEEHKFILGKKKLPDDVRLGVIYPKKVPFTMFSQDEYILKEAAFLSAAFTEELFA